MKYSTFGSVLLAALGLLACGSDDEPSPIELGPGRYAVAATQFSPEGQTTLVGLVEDPTQEQELDLRRALELGGAAALFGPDGRDLFALGTSDEPTLTRYELVEQRLEKRESVSLADYGITSGFKRPELVPFVAADKAYWLDDASAQVVVWNPESMEITGSFSLEGAQREGAMLELGEAVKRDELVFVSASYYLEDETTLPGAVLLVLDTTKDELVDVLTSDACGGAEALLLAGDGTLYAATDPFSASLHALQKPADFPAPCLLRVLPGERELDASFQVATAELTGGNLSGGLVRGAGGSAYLLALHEELLDEPIGADTDIYAPYEASAWRWWRVELGSEQAGELVEDVPAGSAATRVLTAGKQDFISLTSFDTGMTTLLVPRADGSLTPGLQMLGYPYGLIQLH